MRKPLDHIRSYFDTPLHLMLTLACILAWGIVVLSLAGYVVTRNKLVTISVDSCVCLKQ